MSGTHESLVVDLEQLNWAHESIVVDFQTMNRADESLVVGFSNDESSPRVVNRGIFKQ